MLSVWQWKKRYVSIWFLIFGLILLFFAAPIDTALVSAVHCESGKTTITLTVVAILLLCMGIWLSLVREKYENRLAISKEEFGRIFRKMSVDLSTPGVRRIVQLRVDTVLTQLADRLDDACRRQEDYLKEIKAASGDAALVEEMLGKVNDLAREVRLAKANFWSAHRLAKNFEYEVRDSFKMYLC